MPRLFALALLLSAALQLFADTPGVLFSRRFGEQIQASAFDVKTDGAGNVYMCGFAFGTGFPLVHPLQTTGTIFLVKLDAGGNILFSTMLGTGFSDSLGGMAVDAAGNVYLTGWTSSAAFPTTADAVQRTFAGGIDAFVMKIDPTGQRILYSTLLGGQVIDQGLAIALDEIGAIYVAGMTSSDDFPVTSGGALAQRGKLSLFVTKLVPDGSFLQYSSVVENTPIARVRLAVTNLTEATVLVGDGAGTRILKLDAAGARVVYRTTMPSGVGVNALASDANGFIWAAGAAGISGAATPDAAQTQFGGKAYFRSADGGATWTGGEGLDAGVVNQILPVSGNLYGATDSGLFQSGDAGAHWTRLLADTVLHIAADPVATGTLYVARRGATPLAKSTDGGATWQDLDPGAPANPPLVAVAVDPANPATIYAGAARVYRSDDGGATWNASAPLPGNGITGMAVDPRDSSVLYVSLSIAYAGCGIAPCIPITPGVMRSIDGGKTFQSSDVNNYTSSFAIDGTRPGTAYAAGSVVYKTVDFGAHWSPARGPSTPDAYPVVAVQVEDSGVVLVLAGDGRVFRSTDGGDTFSQTTDFRIAGAATLAVVDGVIHLGGRRGNNAYIAKLDLSGNIVYATYWGGRIVDTATAIALDADGFVYVGGAGSSPDFPERNQAREFSGSTDAFVMKLDPAGGVVYATSWGGSAFEQTAAIAAGGKGKVYFTGNTNSTDFPAAQRGSVFLAGFQ